MSNSFEAKVAFLSETFRKLPTLEERYNYIMELGRTLPPLEPAYLTPNNLVSGCQSTLYIRAYLSQEKLYFAVHSDALISAGLAAILLSVYSGEPPQTLLSHPPTFLRDLGILASLSPSRSNGMAHIHQRMKQEALRHLAH